MDAWGRLWRGYAENSSNDDKYNYGNHEAYEKQYSDGQTAQIQVGYSYNGGQNDTSKLYFEEKKLAEKRKYEEDRLEEIRKREEKIERLLREEKRVRELEQERIQRERDVYIREKKLIQRKREEAERKAA